MPEPKRSGKESLKSYRSRLIGHYREKGYPDGHGQAAAIAYSKTGTSRNQKRGKRQARRNPRGGKR